MRKIILKILEKLNILPLLLYVYGLKYRNSYFHLKYRKKIIFMLIPNYGNLGDQAIAIATLKYLSEYLSEYELIQVSLEETYIKMKAIERVINNDDLIILQGGGNFGNLYMNIEKPRRFILKHLSNNKIISMPITATFTDNKNGVKELKRSQKIYKNKHFIIFAREVFTYDFLKVNFPSCSIVLNPDMVFFLYDYEYAYRFRIKRDILLCLRHDKESVLCKNIEEIITFIMDNYQNARFSDTTITRNVPNNIRKYEVNSILYEFYHSELVITDRMHGMILAAITGTPCIVTRSFDKKIEGSYKWLKDLNYIIYLDNFEEITLKESIDKLKKIENITKLNVSHYFEEMKNYFECR